MKLKFFCLFCASIIAHFYQKVNSYFFVLTVVLELNAEVLPWEKS